jgi:hypothetical protein
MDIDVKGLDSAQYFGLACVVDGHPFRPGDHPVRVGFVGDDLHPVHACDGQCARQVTQLVMQRTQPKHALR